MAMSLAEGVVTLRANDTQLRSSLRRTNRGLKAIGKTAAATGALLKSAFMPALGMAALIGTSKKLLELHNAQQDAEAQLAARLKATDYAAGLTSKQIRNYASELQKLTKFGDEVTISAAAMLLQFTKIHGDTFKRTIKASMDMATAMNTELTPAMQMLGLALESPKKGLERLARSGVTFTKQEKERIFQLEKENKVLEYQEILLGRVISVMGGAAEAAAKTFSGRTQQMWNAVGDLGENVVKPLVPALTTLAEVLNAIAVSIGDTDWSGWSKGLEASGTAAKKFISKSEGFNAVMRMAIPGFRSFSPTLYHVGKFAQRARSTGERLEAEQKAEEKKAVLAVAKVRRVVQARREASAEGVTDLLRGGAIKGIGAVTGGVSGLGLSGMALWEGVSGAMVKGIEASEKLKALDEKRKGLLTSLPDREKKGFGFFSAEQFNKQVQAGIDPQTKELKEINKQLEDLKGEFVELFDHAHFAQ